MAECNDEGRASRLVTRQPTNGRNRRVVLGLIVSMALVGASCSSASNDLPDVEGVVQLNEADGSAGASYELSMQVPGDQQRRRLHRPVPVGTVETIDVVITSPTGELTATLSLVVEASMADGSSQTMQLTVERIGASDEATDDALQRAVGSTLTASTDEAFVVAQADITVLGALPEGQVFWVERMLEAPIAFAGPIPIGPVGEGAAWIYRVESNGQERAEDRTLTALNADRSVVTVSSDNDAITGVVEAELGRAVPVRQEIVVGDWITSVIVRN